MDRRQFLKWSSAALLGAAMPGTAHRPGVPNVLFISVEDMRPWLGCYGDSVAHTPNMDRLAGCGTLFENAYAPAPVCGPSRTATLSGLRPSRTGMRSNTDDWRKCLDGIETLPLTFQRAGYQTAAAGKIWHGDVTVDPRIERRLCPHRPPFPVRNPVRVLPDHPGMFDYGPCGWSDTRDPAVTDWAVRLLARCRPPFFIALGLAAPHIPWCTEQRFHDLFPANEMPLPEGRPRGEDIPRHGERWPDTKAHQIITGRGHWRLAVSSYRACIAATDYYVGRILEALDASGHADNTLVVLWSDHGLHLGEKTHWRKCTLWRPSCQVPLLMAGPGIPRGQRVQAAVSLLDIYPTLLRLTGLAAPHELDGRDLRPLMGGAGTETAVVTEAHGGRGVAIRTERWCWISYNSGAEELYDYRSDPYERHNLSGDPDWADVPRRLRALDPLTE